MWIARDKDGSINLFEHKPNRRTNATMIGYEEQLPKCIWKSIGCDKHAIYQIAPVSNVLNKICENITWEDEPVEVVINKVNPSNPAFPWRWCEEHTYNEREREVWLAGWDKCREYVKNEFGIKV